MNQEEYYNPEQWYENDDAPVQLLCKDCGALFITDVTMDNSCPVCVSYDTTTVGPHHDPEYQDEHNNSE